MYILELMGNEHIEADTRIIAHLTYMSELDRNRVVIIRCNDADVPCILCHHKEGILYTLLYLYIIGRRPFDGHWT